MSDHAARAFTTQFLNADFSPFGHLLKDLQITDLLATTQCPAVEVQNLDLATLDSLHDRCQTITARFRENPTGARFRHWYNMPRSQGWQMMSVVGVQDYLRDDRGAKTDLEVPGVDDEIKRSCQALFGPWWDDLIMLNIMKLEPDGWINPHVDGAENYGLNYFWIPLHAFPHNCMKVFPLGWLRHTLGSLYLFNQSKYPHALQNTTDQSRYVLVGRFDPDRVPGDITQAYLQKKQDFLSVFRY